MKKNIELVETPVPVWSESTPGLHSKLLSELDGEAEKLDFGPLICSMLVLDLQSTALYVG